MHLLRKIAAEFARRDQERQQMLANERVKDRLVMPFVATKSEWKIGC